jgi:Flp pilus assembly protein TadB
MVYLLITSIFILCLSLLVLLLKTPKDFADAKYNKFLHYRLQNDFDYIEKFDEYFESNHSKIIYYLGDRISFKFLMPSLLIFFFSCAFIAPLLTSIKFSIPLGLIISLAYISRLFYSHQVNFRSKLLRQLERILRSIRNNLSTGMTLDYAVTSTIKYSQEKPLGQELKAFIKLSDTNFLENFPKWLLRLKKTFGLKELNKSAQLLSLELKYNTNQEEAFLNAVNQIADRISWNDKQKSTVAMALFTMDFMVLMLFAVLFFVIPNISANLDNSWWDSDRRVIVVFISASVVWLCYLVTTLIMIWRQN